MFILEKKGNDKKKRGIKTGFLFYKEYHGNLLKSISGTMTTKDVMIAFNNKLPLGVELSWNTVHKYLGLLEEKGKVTHEIIGGAGRKIHIWRSN